MTRFLRLSTWLIICLTSIAATHSQITEITGVTIDLNGATMYYTREIDGKSLFYTAEKNADGTWTSGVPAESLNAHVEGYVVKSPFLSYDGTALYFSSNIPGSEGFDIYCSRKAGDQWLKPEKTPVINSDDDETNPSLSADNMTMYFTRKSIGRESACLTIYRTERDASGNWTYPLPAPLPGDPTCENTPTISPDGRTLFFASDRASEKRRRKFNVYHSESIGGDLWSAPAPTDTVTKEYNEYHPAIDYAAGELHVVRFETGKNKIRQELFASPLSPRLTKRPFTVVEGTVKNLEGKPIATKILVRDALSFAIVARYENDANTGEYRIVAGNGKRYAVEMSNEKSASAYWLLNTTNNEDNRRIEKDFVLFDKLKLELEIYDDFTGKAVDAELNFHPQENKERIEHADKGRYICYIPLNRQIDVEIRKTGYSTETVSVKIPYEQQFAELKHIVKLKPGLRRGELKVEDVYGNQAMNAEVRIKNLDKADESVSVESTTKGAYSFTLRKNDRYSLSILKKGYMYFHTVWQPDDGGVRRALTVRLVPLNQIDKIEMRTMRFNADTTEFSAESSSELDCIVAIARNEPGVTASISIPSDGSETNVNAAEKLMRMIGYYLTSKMVPQSQYSIAKVPKASASQIDDKEEIRPFIQFVERRHKER